LAFVNCNPSGDRITFLPISISRFSPERFASKIFTASSLRLVSEQLVKGEQLKSKEGLV
jgi:hypothetical protein